MCFQEERSDARGSERGICWSLGIIHGAKLAQTWCKVYVRALKAGPVLLFSFLPAASFSPSLPSSPSLPLLLQGGTWCLQQLLKTQLIYHCLSLAQFLNLSWLQRPELIPVLLVLLLWPRRLDWHLMMAALSQARRSGGIYSLILFTTVPILGPLHVHTDYPACAFLQGGC